MAKRLAVDDAGVFRVKVKGELTSCVSTPHRAEYAMLAREKEMLAKEKDGFFIFLNPIGSISRLKKECVEILGPAPRPVVKKAVRGRERPL